MKSTLTLAVAALLASGAVARAQLLVADDYGAANVNSGFALGEGVNSGINPPDTTRLAGSAASGLRYVYTQTGATIKPTSIYTLTPEGKVQIPRSANSGRFSLSADGTTPLNFAPLLYTAGATPADPFVYDITISMANTLSGTTRFSFGIATVEADVTTWDFGLQLYRAVNTDTFYQIGKRIDTGSSGLASDLNASIMATAAGTSGSELNFLIRVTDAGAESGGNYSSQVKVSLDGGSTWFYDTEADASLVNGWRFDSATRYFIWDQAGQGSGTGAVTYDNFSVTLIHVPEPSTLALGALGGVFLLAWRRRR